MAHEVRVRNKVKKGLLMQIASETTKLRIMASSDNLMVASEFTLAMSVDTLESVVKILKGTREIAEAQISLNRNTKVN